jgi:hypothetical protein
MWLDWLGRTRKLENWALAAGFVTIFGAALICSFLWAISYPPFSPTSRDASTYSEAQRLEHERHEKAANERGLTVATWVLAFITGALVLATGLLGVGTFIAAKAAQKSAEHIPTAERAYIYGGVGKRQIISDRNGAAVAIGVQITMANYGKTPAFVKCIRFGTCRIDELPDIPVYTEEADVSDMYFPLMTMDKIRVTRAAVELPLDGTHVVFQRVFFEDIFRKERSSGSVYRMYLDEQGRVRDEPVAAKLAYWKWD